MLYVSSMVNAAKTLDEIFEMIPEGHAASVALRNFHTQKRNKASAYTRAKAGFITLLIASGNNVFDEHKNGYAKLLAWFKKNNYHDEAALLLLAKARYLFTLGDIPGGENCLGQVQKHLLQHLSPLTEVAYLYQQAHVCATKAEYAQRMFIAGSALEKLNAIVNRNSWWNAHFVSICTVMADVYQRNGQFDEALTHLKQALDVLEKHQLANGYKFMVYRYMGLHYNFRAHTQESIDWYKRALQALDTGENIPYRVVLNNNICYQYYWLFQETPTTQKKKRMQILEAALLHVMEAEKNARLLKSEVHLANVWVNRCRIELLKQNYSDAIRLLDKAQPILKKQKHDRSIVEYYQLGHKIYYAWGMQSNNLKLVAKAYEYLEHHRNMVVEDAKKTTVEKLDAVKATYELQQKKLNEQLMKQQIDALNKELQLVSLNLHDRIMVLDEVKDHVNIMRRKGMEINQLSKSIIHKIESVKITEQDKNRLEQKLAESNKALSRILAQKYPQLTKLEITMCTFFKTGITDKELAKLYGQSYKSYEQHRWRIKKKMKLDRKTNLVNYLQGLTG